jgi:hypothetical protein
MHISYTAHVCRLRERDPEPRMVLSSASTKQMDMKANVKEVRAQPVMCSAACSPSLGGLSLMSAAIFVML